jgi:hypothetical protein
LTRGDPGSPRVSRRGRSHDDQEADRGGEAERPKGPAGRDEEAHDREPAVQHASRARQAGRRGSRRGGKPGRALEDRNRQQLYELAKEKQIPGRSKMGKWDLIKAIRRA